MASDNSDNIEQRIEISGRVGQVVQIGKIVGRFIDERIFKRLGLEQRIGFILLGILVIGAAIALYLALRPRSPSRMTTDFRIAVAGLAERGRSGDSEIGTELAQGVYLRLEQTFDELNLGFTITIWGPDRVGTVKGQDDTERANSAAQIARKIGADIVVYGWVDTTGPVWQVAPEFYVAAENFYEAQEITGQHEIGTPLAVMGQGNIAARIEVSDEFTSRTLAIAQITVGLAFYSVHNFEQALVFFQSAEDVKGWEEDEGKQILCILIGNAAAKADKLGLAQAYYQKSLALDPEYARAYVGLAGVDYMLALKPFEKTLNPTDIDDQMIAQAIEAYQQALEAKHQPPLSDITTKVHFGLGQCHFLLIYYEKEGSFNPAIAEFEAVIEEYADGVNSRVRELAAESHARLALIYDLSDHPDLAIRNYQMAASLLWDNPDRQSLYEERAQTIKNNVSGTQ